MKCRKCSQKAVINMRQHKLALCKDHFPEWIVELTQRFITKYNMFNTDDKVLVAVSGGKDSLSLWDILCRLGYKVDGLYIGLGIDGGINYSDKSQKYAKLFASQRNLNLHIVDVPRKYSHSIPEMADMTERGRSKPCAVCGLTKRHVMNQIAREGGYQVLVTGHNLDDEAAVLFGNTLNWLTGYMSRQYPVLEATHPGLIRKAKPLFRFYEREMAAYALLRGIEYIYDECPYVAGSKSLYYKEFLNSLEATRPGAKLIFLLSFLRAKKEGMFANKPQAGSESDQRGAAGEILNTCSTCGQPTTAPDECAFCRMMNKLLEL